MTQPNDSAVANGNTIATHLKNNKEFQVVILADQDGLIQPAIPVSGTITTNEGTVKGTTLHVSGTGVAAAGVTATLPAVAGQKHYITGIRIVLYNSSARTGTATPIVSTSTNLPGSPAFTWPSAGAIGTVLEQSLIFSAPLVSSAANTATTIVCPATAGVIWRVNVSYYTAV